MSLEYSFSHCQATLHKISIDEVEVWSLHQTRTPYYNPSQYKYRVIEELHIVQQQSWIATATAYTVLSELYTVLPCIEAC